MIPENTSAIKLISQIKKIDLIKSLGLNHKYSNGSYNLSTEKGKNGHQYFLGNDGDWLFYCHSSENPDFPVSGSNVDYFYHIGVNNPIEMASQLGINTYDLDNPVYAKKQRKESNNKNLTPILVKNQGIEFFPVAVKTNISKEELLELASKKQWVFPSARKEQYKLIAQKYKNSEGKKNRYTFEDFKNNKKNNIYTINDTKNELGMPVFGTSDVPPYNFDKLRNESFLFIFEGEKDCDTAKKLGLNSITFFTSSKENYAKWLKKIKEKFPLISNIIIFCDNDKSGISQAKYKFLAATNAGFKSLVINPFSQQLIYKFDYFLDLPKYSVVGDSGYNESLGFDFYNYISNLVDSDKDINQELNNLIKTNINTFNSLDLSNKKPKEQYQKELLESWIKRLEIKPHVTFSAPKMNSEVFNLSEFLSNCNEKFIGIKARQGTGKTHSIVQFLENEKDIFTDFLTHRNSLAKDFAQKCNKKGIKLYHFEDFKNDGLDVTSQNGISLCVDSNKQKDGVDLAAIHEMCREKNLIIVIDEIEQFCKHFISADTEIKKHRTEAAMELAILLNLAHKVIVADADLSYLAKNFIDGLMKFSGVDTKNQWRIIENTYNNDGFTYHRMKNKETLLIKLAEMLRKKLNSEIEYPIALVTGSQQIGSNVSSSNVPKIIRKMLRLSSDEVKNLKILIIDSEEKDIVDSLINKLGVDWTKKLGEFDLVIMSPSVETGTDIGYDVKFSAVFGNFAGNQPVESVIQHLCRVRHSCDRYVYMNNQGTYNSNEGLSQRAIKESLIINGAKNKSLIKSLLDDSVDFSNNLEDIDENDLGSFLVNQYCAFQSRDNLSSKIYPLAVEYLLQSRGHKLGENLKCDKDSFKEIKELAEKSKLELAEEKQKEIFSQDDIGKEEAQELSKKNGKKTKKEFQQLEKYYFQNKFGKYAPNEIFIADILSKKQLKKQLKLAYYLEFEPSQSLNSLPWIEKNTYENTNLLYELKDKMFSYKLSILENIRIKELLTLKNTENFTNEHHLLDEIFTLCVRFKKEIYTNFGINFTENKRQFKIKLFNSLLAKIGYSFELESQDKLGKRYYKLYSDISDSSREYCYKHFFMQSDVNLSIARSKQFVRNMLEVYEFFYAPLGYQRDRYCYDILKERLEKFNDKVDKRGDTTNFITTDSENSFITSMEKEETTTEETVTEMKETLPQYGLQELLINLKTWIKERGKASYFNIISWWEKELIRSQTFVCNANELIETAVNQSLIENINGLFEATW